MYSVKFKISKKLKFYIISSDKFSFMFVICTPVTFR